MSARQLRINQDYFLKLKVYNGKKISLVLKNGEVHYGYLKILNKDTLCILNLSRKKFTFPFQTIDEVLIELN
jgi:hypothetical protein